MLCKTFGGSGIDNTLLRRATILLGVSAEIDELNDASSVVSILFWDASQSILMRQILQRVDVSSSGVCCVLLTPSFAIANGMDKEVEGRAELQVLQQSCMHRCWPAASSLEPTGASICLGPLWASWDGLTRAFYRMSSCTETPHHGTALLGLLSR